MYLHWCSTLNIISYYYILSFKLIFNENEHIKISEEDHNNSSYENEEDEDEVGDENYHVRIVFIFNIFSASHRK